ncbi:ATP-binding cassette domain-containing protein [Intestinibacter bartlettii]|uniref:ATP-binding cassette domain-containing protein n=1 Tax=Intestinibacter bartlettii TaxID=261299 RepID=UPI001D12E0EE|nr:ATP-binding cassette domain-containing protein [Intestinibacter bartlettii]MCC2705611.1 ATP-binding cassette domain-containing protein [Intestinibacter bartlettii]MCC2761061.1 ATP-binding cassette domain-containing protein [Intestinibacter bartlettii]MDU6472017.1 ATP-binding cassette domain-containing protein [Intestinibacter bartlettii]
MKIDNLIINNIDGIKLEVKNNESIGLEGLSGSGKTSFCKALNMESLKRIVTILPKSEYKFLFSDLLVSNFSTQSIKDMPLIFFLEKSSSSYNPRSTIGTHTEIYNFIRKKFAKEHNLVSEIFSFNNSIYWCKKCKGRGYTNGIECKECEGTRYSDEIKQYKLRIKDKDYTIIDINKMDIYTLKEIAVEIGLPKKEMKILENMIKLNIGYLTLDRIVSTLSGGETVRLFLSEFMTLGKNCIIIIDEISIGLDANSINNILRVIDEMGCQNQIWLIDHSDIVLDSTINKISFGPGSGKNGGKIINDFNKPKEKYFPKINSKPRDYYEFFDLNKRNIDIKKLTIPKNRLTIITGESGCGKSTLINDCILPYFKKKYKNKKIILIGQDRNKSITSRSTIETFLDIKSKLSKLGNNYNLLQIDELIKILPKKDKKIKQKIELILDLGLGYLDLNRKINTLSTGEFQCIHLISELCNDNNDEILLIFDEPSKGLSQNILNKFMYVVRNILNNNTVTMIMIEHNPYIIRNADFIIDFGKRTDQTIKNLDCVSYSQWDDNIKNIKSVIKLKSNIPLMRGIEYIDTDIDDYYKNAEKDFKGGLLKNISQTARWIYSDFESDVIMPKITIDLEERLYSKNTFLYEIGGLFNYIISLNKENKDVLKFDYYNKDNLCEFCKGTGKVSIFDFNKVVKDGKKGLWNGLLYDDVMEALRKYNYSKIKFLFKEIKKDKNIDLSKSFNSMTSDEKNIFLYGYWEKSFYDTSKKTKRMWKGMQTLILKYIRSSKSELKQKIIDSKHESECPICNGNILNHNNRLIVFNKDIREILNDKISENKFLISQIEWIQRIVKILNNDIYLNTDVSSLSHEMQVQLKLLEIEMNNYYGYQIVLKNVLPFKNLIQEYIENISKNNLVTICDYKDINITKESILKTYFSSGKIKSNTYIYEILGYKNITSKINKIRKSFPCGFCKGKKVLREESIVEGIDVLESICNSCNGTGISKVGLEQIVDSYPVEVWLENELGELDIIKNIPKSLLNIKLTSKINELNKVQLMDLLKIIKK